MKELNIIVNFVSTRQLRKGLFANMRNLSTKELNIIVMFVTTRHLQKTNFAT